MTVDYEIGIHSSLDASRMRTHKATLLSSSMPMPAPTPSDLSRAMHRRGGRYMTAIPVALTAVKPLIWLTHQTDG